jgi:Na+-driven multidrug efflux pump
VVGISTLAALSVAYGLERQDRFEIVILSACWLALVAGGFVLAALFWTMAPPEERGEPMSSRNPN